MRKKSATVYFVLGEESGDALGVDLFNALQHNAKNKNLDVQVVGLAGERLTKAGVNSLFDINDISVMGISAVLARLPKIVMRVQQTVADIVKKSGYRCFDRQSGFHPRCCQTGSTQTSERSDHRVRLSQRLGMATGQSGQNESLCGSYADNFAL